MSDPTPLIERFMANVEKTDSCWIWTGFIMWNGYGQIKVWEGVDQWRSRIAHRVAHELFIGPIPDGYQVDHLCFIRACVNPEHLEAVTPSENQQRRTALITHCPAGHAYGEDTYFWERPGRTPWRRCRICNTETARRYRARVAAGRAADDEDEATPDG